MLKLFFCRICRWIGSSKWKPKTEIFCCIINVFAATLDQCNAFYLNRESTAGFEYGVSSCFLLLVRKSFKCTISHLLHPLFTMTAVMYSLLSPFGHVSCIEMITLKKQWMFFFTQPATSDSLLNFTYHTLSTCHQLCSPRVSSLPLLTSCAVKW